MTSYSFKQVLLEQKEETAALLRKEKIIPRDIRGAAKLFGSDMIKAVTGVRRCGKSVLAHRLLGDKSYGYANFDDERLAGIKNKDLNQILELINEISPGCAFLFFDEIQNVEGWELFVNRLKRRGYDITISGSNSRLLSSELATHLTGRHFTIELFPFSFKEFLRYNGVEPGEEDAIVTERRAQIKRLLEQYMMSGGLPETLKLEPKRAYLRELYDRIITRDIIMRHGVKYGKTLKETALYAVSNFSSMTSYRKIQNVFDIRSVHTAKNYLDYLEEACLLFQMEAFSPKMKERLIHPRKIYCIDTGMINALVPEAAQNYGRLMENLVFLELKRRGWEIYFYHTSGNYEVDFLVRQGRNVRQLIQVCFSTKGEDTLKREKRALLKASRELGCQNLLVITWDTEAEERHGPLKMNFLPLWKWLLRFDKIPTAC